MMTATASPTTAFKTPLHTQIIGQYTEGYAEILTPAALAFLRELHIHFNARRLALLAARDERQKRLDAGELPDFLPETKQIREADWTIAALPSTQSSGYRRHGGFHTREK